MIINSPLSIIHNAHVSAVANERKEIRHVLLGSCSEQDQHSHVNKYEQNCVNEGVVRGMVRARFEGSVCARGRGVAMEPSIPWYDAYNCKPLSLSLSALPNSTL